MRRELINKSLSKIMAIILTVVIGFIAILPVCDSLANDDYDWSISEDYYIDGDYGYYDAETGAYYGYTQDELDKLLQDLEASESTGNKSGNAYSESVVRKNDETGYSAIIYDGADLLTDSEERALLNVMMNITVEGNALFYTSNTSSSSSVMKEAENVFYQFFNDHDSATMFMVNMKLRELVVYSDGKIHEKVTDDFGYTITDNVYTYASDKEYALCATKAFEMINDLLNDVSIAQPMKVVCNVFIALNLGFFICYLIANGKSKASKASDSEMLKYAVINITNENTNAVLTNTTKRYVPRSSGGGGHGGGHGGGGHSGGGGHHGF